MRSYWTTTLLYLLFGLLWILFTDLVLVPMASTPEELTVLQTGKGAVFVVVSGLLVLFLSHREHRRRVRLEKEKDALYRGTLEAVQHIVLNYLNEMQLITDEAENSDDFDQRLLPMAREMSHKTASQLRNLELIRNPKSEAVLTEAYMNLRSGMHRG